VALSTCDKCNPKLARGGTVTTREREPHEGECPNTLVRVTLGPNAAERAGIELYDVEPRTLAETIRANAETRYVPSKYARVAPRMAGVVREVAGVLGQEVDAGALLATVESAAFGEAKSDYLQALTIRELRQSTYDQEKALADKNISSGRDLFAAKTALAEAEIAARRGAQRLATLGLTEAQVEAVAKQQDTSPALAVTAPFKGVVLDVTAVIGDAATAERPLFVVADVERLWVAIDVGAAALAEVETDQRVVFTVDELPGQRFPGKVVAIGGEVDEHTRTVRVIAEVKNPRGLLKANLFGRAEIMIRPAEPKLLVPKQAVQNDGDCNLVFVSGSPNVFQARKVQLGTVYESGFEVTAGLAAGEKIATTGSFLLKTEVLRGQMGVG
jgi:cobalt-zinc-cadmium efflux system membrane fusion protein